MIQKLFKKLNTSGGMIAVTSFSNIIVSVLNVIGGLLVAKLLLPEELGLFNTFSIFTSYIILSQMGIPSGLSRQLPFFYGQNQHKRAHNYAETAQFFSLVTGVLVALVCLLVGVYFLLTENYHYAFGSFVIAVTSFQSLYVAKYLKVLYRSNTEFNKLAIINTIVALVSISSVYFVWKFGFYGLGGRVALIAITDFYLSYWLRPVKVKPNFSKSRLIELFSIGAPIYFVSTVYSLWPTIQRTVIVSLGGARALGLYAIANIIQNMLNTLNNSVSSVIFPKMSFEFGKGKEFKELMQLPLKFVRITAIIYFAGAIIGWNFIETIIEYLLPEYSEGVEAAKWMFIVGLVSIFTIFSNVYMVVKKNMDRLKAYVTGIAVWAIAVIIFYNFYGFRLEIFPKALIIAYLATFSVDLYFYNLYSKAKTF